MTNKNGLMFLVKTQDLKILVVGSGKIARRKIFKLSDAGADFTVVSKDKPSFTAARVKFVVDEGLNYTKKNISNFDIIVAATNNKEVNNKIAELALKEKTSMW